MKIIDSYNNQYISYLDVAHINLKNHKKVLDAVKAAPSITNMPVDQCYVIIDFKDLKWANLPGDYGAFNTDYIDYLNLNYMETDYFNTNYLDYLNLNYPEITAKLIVVNANNLIAKVASHFQRFMTERVKQKFVVS